MIRISFLSDTRKKFLSLGIQWAKLHNEHVQRSYL